MAGDTSGSEGGPFGAGHFRQRDLKEAGGGRRRARCWAGPAGGVDAGDAARRRARVQKIETLGADGRPTVRFEADVADPVVGIMVRTLIGMEVYGTNTQLEQVKLGPVAAGETRVVRFEFPCLLCPQEYTLTAASHDPDGVWHDWLEDALAAIRVSDVRYTAGVANLRAKVRVEG